MCKCQLHQYTPANGIDVIFFCLVAFEFFVIQHGLNAAQGPSCQFTLITHCYHEWFLAAISAHLNKTIIHSPNWRLQSADNMKSFLSAHALNGNDNAHLASRQSYLNVFEAQNVSGER